jgi:hypothetical protein
MIIFKNISQIWLNLKGSLLIVLLALCFISCGKPVSPTIGIDRNEISEPIVHVVRSNNETMKEIAEWYTGKASNAAILLNYNSSNLKGNIKKGDVILIPQKLLVTRKTFIKKASSKKSPDTKKEKKIAVEIKSDNAKKSDILGVQQQVEPSNQIEKHTVQVEPRIDPLPIEGTPTTVSDSEQRRLELLKELMKK